MKLAQPCLLSSQPHPLGLYFSALKTLARKPQAEATLPALHWRGPTLKIDERHVSNYAALCGFTAPERNATEPAVSVPITYPHLLAFPLQLSLMCHASFPYPLPGLIHLANHIRQQRSLHVHQSVRLEVCNGLLRSHEKGQLFDLESRLVDSDDEQLLWSSTSTYLYRSKAAIQKTAHEENHAITQGAAYVSQIPAVSSQKALERWPLEASLGRRYARISGDLNPIHLSAWTARLFGFPKTILHGMWAQARALAFLLPAAAIHPDTPLNIEIEFKTPITLPGEITLWTETYQNQTDHLSQIFELRDSRGEKPHLRGRWQTISRTEVHSGVSAC